jgi:hypothetical protein
MIDVNAVLRQHLASDSAITALVEQRVYVPRLPENAGLPAIGLFVRGGASTPYIPGILTPSFQIDCWADDPVDAREVYRAVYDALQGIQNITVSMDGTDYLILGAEEETQGQDLVDVDIPGYFRVLSFFSIMMREVT